MDKLQDSVQRTLKLPDGLRQSIEALPTDEKFEKACKYLKQWSRQELHEMRLHIIKLEELSEKVTNYCSTATGRAFPEVLAITSPRWTMSHYKTIEGRHFSVESEQAIRDLTYVSAILKSLD
mmetsp:Transcript_17947/g.44359  ORF Transcript_17947/g.44359 Transcript_17947/m.44359 type:complete len:122 (+) Transcript_17947:2602-2967(+)